MLEILADLLKEHGIHFVVELLLLLSTYLAVRSRNVMAQTIDELHRRRMDDVDRALKLAERAKEIIRKNGHES